MAENESAADYGCQEYFKEAVCIDAQRVYDSCSDKDCIEDIRVLFPAARQSLVDSASNVRVREVNVITVYIDLQPIPFNKGFYSVDMTFFFDVCLDLFGGTASCPVPINGVAIFNKKVVLYGSEGNVKLFTSGCSMDDVQAEDARVLPKGTGYVTDLGMTGPRDSVLGIRPELSIAKFRGDLPERYRWAEGAAKMEAVLFTIDSETGKCRKAERVDKWD